MANFIKPYNDDPFVGHLATPITSSAVTRAILKNLPAYRFGLTPLLRGLEIGLAHGYFLIGPFVKLGPLRNSEVALFAGFLSTIGFVLQLKQQSPYLSVPPWLSTVPFPDQDELGT